MTRNGYLFFLNILLLRSPNLIDYYNNLQHPEIISKIVKPVNINKLYGIFIYNI